MAKHTTRKSLRQDRTPDRQSKRHASYVLSSRDDRDAARDLTAARKTYGSIR